jgi:hypothetical protein
MASEVGSWGRPPDRPSQIALGLGVLLVILAAVPTGCAWLASLVDFSGVSDLTRRRRFLGIAGFVAAFLSLGYIAFYLRGGPRDLLSPAYWVQGRALAHGELSWSASDPVASFRASRMLGSLPDRAAGVLPPGFPLLLAAGFLVGAPMLVGPLLAAALVVATWGLARELAAASGPFDARTQTRAEIVGRVAAGLSMVSVALRHFTADALPHGAVALGVACALAAALRARRTGDRRMAGLAGLAVGFVLATEPLSAVPIGAVALALFLGARDRRVLVWGLCALVPGVLLLLSANRAATGAWLALPAHVYASLLATPVAPRHGPVVRVLLALRAHLADMENFEPLALLAIVPFVRGRSRAAVMGGIVVAGQLAVAAISAVRATGAERGLVAVLPIEHALAAIALAQLFPTPLATARAAVGTLGIALAGFAVHTSRDHVRVAESDLGHPHYEPDVAREMGVANGLLYFEDDQGFELAYDPEASASHGVEAARLLGDDHDRLLYDLLGHPQIHRYTATGTTASVTAWTPPNTGSDSWRFEAESDWPGVSLEAARAEVSEGAPACASDGKGLTVRPRVAGGQGSATLSLPVPRGAVPPDRRTWTITPRAIQRGGGGSATLWLVTSLGGPPLARWTWDDATKVPGCVDLPAQTVELGGDRPRAWLVLTASTDAVTLDKTTLRSR